MKKILLIASLTAFCNFSFCILPCAAQAADTSPAPDHTSFFNTTLGYFTSFNPELEGQLTNHAGTFWTGPVWKSGAHNATALGLEYSVYKNFAAISETRFEDVTGNVAAQRLGVGYNINVHDVRLTGYVAGEYNFDKANAKAGGVIGLSVIKLLTEHTFTGLQMDVPLEKNTVPLFTIKVGILF